MSKLYFKYELCSRDLHSIFHLFVTYCEQTNVPSLEQKSPSPTNQKTKSSKISDEGTTKLQSEEEKNSIIPTFNQHTIVSTTSNIPDDGTTPSKEKKVSTMSRLEFQ